MNTHLVIIVYPLNMALLNCPEQGSNFSSHACKMRVKKAISEVVFSLLAFFRGWKFWAVIRGSYPRYISSLQFP